MLSNNIGDVMAEKKEQQEKEEKKESAKEKSKSVISKDMSIGDIVAKNPKSAEIMFKNGMHCVGCGMMAYESLEQGCKVHGMSDEDIDKMVDEINKSAEDEKGKQKPL